MAAREAGRFTIALVEESGWSLDSVALQLVQWGYRVLPVRLWDLYRDVHGVQKAAVILTRRHKGEIECIMKTPDHPPVVTTDHFDLMLRHRIENYLRHAALPRLV
jgi:hypothetical protein